MSAALVPLLPALPEPVEETVVLHRYQTSRSHLEGRHLESFRDMLRAERDFSNPVDLERSGSCAAVRLIEENYPVLRLADRNGYGNAMPLTRTAMSQLATAVLPKGGLRFLDHLSAITGNEGNPVGKKLAEMNWASFLKDRDEPLFFRTAIRNGQRTVRAVLSTRYQVYDNLDFIEDLISALGSEVDTYRAIDWRLDDTALRLRLIGGSEGLETWSNREVNKPIPMVETWNSEVGRKAVHVNAGTYTLWCSNGCGHWSDNSRRRWNHVGRTSDRIRDGVAGAIEDALTKGRGIVEAYEKALETAIDDAFAWFEAEVKNERLSKKVVGAVETQLSHGETTNKGHNGQLLLASVIDAVTYVAHEQTNLFQQEQLERLGGQLLNTGLNQAFNGRIRADA